MPPQFQVERELFQIPDGRDWIIYAPLRRVALRGNGTLVNLLCDLRLGAAAETCGAREALDRLKQCGIVRPACGQRAPASQARVHDSPFLPLNLTLFLTSGCNLACRYCYGDGGDRTANMPLETGKCAIDTLFSFARQRDAKRVHLGFHGGGEPVLRLGMMQEFTRYARSLARRNKCDLALGLTTNGVMSEAAALWVAKNIRQLNVSLDGPADIQNFQRPLKNGARSFDRVAKTLKIFEAKNVHYHLRGTVTRFGENRVPEIVSYLTTHFSPAGIQLEPMYGSARASKTNLEEPDQGSFVEGMLEAADIAVKEGIRLHFSGDRFPAISYRFCSIGWDNFAVTPEGLATSCFEVMRDEDPRSNIFFFGKYEPGKGFTFQHDRIQRLRALSEGELPRCRDCFAKFHCAGDCRAKALYPDAEVDDRRRTDRCEIIQALTKARLSALLSTGDLVRLKTPPEAPTQC